MPHTPTPTEKKLLDLIGISTSRDLLDEKVDNDALDQVNGELYMALLDLRTNEQELRHTYEAIATAVTREIQALDKGVHHHGQTGIEQRAEDVTRHRARVRTAIERIEMLARIRKALLSPTTTN